MLCGPCVARKLHRACVMKTKFGCIVLPCGCLVPLVLLACGLLVSGGVVLAKSLF
jgi:hypothetical protein